MLCSLYLILTEKIKGSCQTYRYTVCWICIVCAGVILQHVQSLKSAIRFQSSMISDDLLKWDSQNQSKTKLTRFWVDRNIYPQTGTNSCDGLRIEPVTIEKHVDLAFTIFEHILFCLESLFKLFRLSLCMLMNKPFWFSLEKDAATVLNLDTFWVASSVAAIGFVYISTPITFCMWLVWFECVV